MLTEILVELYDLAAANVSSYGGYLLFYIVLSHVIDATIPNSFLDKLCSKERGKALDVDKLRQTKRISARTSIVASVMAIHVSSLALYGLVLGPKLDFNSETPLTRHLVNVAVGFFMWDVLYCWDQGWMFLVHGVAALAVFTGALRPFLHGMALVTLFYEVSTPFLHARKTLIDCNMTQGWGFTIAQYGFAISFFISRIVHGLYACCVWWIAMENDMASGAIAPERVPISRMYQCLCLLLSGLNCYWFSLIALAVVGKEPGRPRNPTHGESHGENNQKNSGEVPQGMRSRSSGSR